MKKLLAVAAIGLMAAGCSNTANVKAGSKLDTDLQYVASMVGIVQQGINQYTSQPTQTNLDDLAQAAQKAHDQIDEWKTNIGIDGNTNTHAVDAQVAAGDLKNSMGALVGWSGNPNAATLASFTTQFEQAAGEWNQAVDALYRGVKSSETPPTISCSAC